MPLDVCNLVELFRSEMSDPELPGNGDDSDSLWSDCEITGWIDEAQRELCERVDLLFDRSSFKIDTVEEQDLYVLDDFITKVRRGIGPNGRKLEAISIAELERRYQSSDWDYDNVAGGINGYNWETLVGTPKYMVTDYAIGMLRLVPIPPKTDAGGTTEEIKLDVYRTPLFDDALEIPSKHRRMLLHRVKAYAYRKDDIDTQDMNRAVVQEQRWEVALNDVDKQFKRLNRGPQITGYGGIPMGGFSGSFHNVRR